jgi:hypothetical protein
VNIIRQNVLATASIVAALLGMVLQAGCSNSKPPAGTETAVAAAGTPKPTPTAAGKMVTTGADAAWYFDDSDDPKLVAVESLSGPAREIQISEQFADKDGLTLIFKSSCQGALSTYTGKTEMVGKASTVVYVTDAEKSLTIVGIEDMSKVQSRLIQPMNPPDPQGPVCHCALKRCGAFLCCPPVCQ